MEENTFNTTKELSDAIDAKRIEQIATVLAKAAVLEGRGKLELDADEPFWTYDPDSNCSIDYRVVATALMKAGLA